MSTIGLIEGSTATGEAKELLDAVQNQLGVTPNIFKTLASSPKALAGFLSLSSNLSQGVLDAKTRTKLALITAETNGCEYCVSAHATIGQGIGLERSQIDAARKGEADDTRTSAALKFARALIDTRGEVGSEDIKAARAAGLGDGEIVEIVAHVALNTLTNYLGKAGRVEIDFPRVPLFAPPVCET